MAKVGSIELTIGRIEHFRMRDASPVAEWRARRFWNVYPGFDVDVLDGDGEIVTAGQTLLQTVRETYEES